MNMHPETGLCDILAGYGCNMSIRASLIGRQRFDERLPLYGWQEDIDFTSRFRAQGRVVSAKSLYGVHLATKAGRQSGLRLALSQEQACKRIGKLEFQRCVSCWLVLAIDGF